MRFGTHHDHARIEVTMSIKLQSRPPPKPTERSVQLIRDSSPLQDKFNETLRAKLEKKRTRSIDSPPADHAPKAKKQTIRPPEKHRPTVQALIDCQ